MLDDTLISSIAAMLAVRSPNAINVKPWTTGGNNRVFIVSSGVTKVLAKWYYTNTSDQRDRLHAEWSFLKYAERAGITCVPRPISCDPARRLALYEFVNGRKLDAGEVSRGEIGQAASFFRRLNDPSKLAGARELPAASEACFSIVEHCALIDRRLERLRSVMEESDVDREASALVLEIDDAWTAHKEAITAGAKRLSWAPGTALDLQERCVSPSDFGFHNILARDNGELCFVDFEYAGWDDPAKMAGDFFFQPAVPIDSSHFEWFLEQTFGTTTQVERVKARARLLRPMFGIKWCCIVLNIFVAELANRARFANPGTDIVLRKREQLRKAKAAFARIGS